MEPIKLILIEDNIKDSNEFKTCINERTDVKLVGATNSDIEGLTLIKKLLPDVVILDIELTSGTGHTTSFPLIEELSKLKLKHKPKIIINTIVSSNAVYDYLHEKGVDLIFYKKHPNYSIKNVIDTIALLNNYSEDVSFTGNATIDNSEDFKEKLNSIIENELNLIGIGLHLQGRKYLHDAIYLLIAEPEKAEQMTIVQYLVAKYKRSNSTISRAMQNAILHAWRISCIEDLEKYYPYKVNYETGIPTTNEFIFNMTDKIKKAL
jgi:DNA-binding NarL/FixJ family response regulator